MPTLADLKQRADEHAAELVALDHELMDLAVEWKQLTHERRTAPRGTSAADLAAIQRDLDIVARRIRELEPQREQAATLASRAEREYLRAASVVAAAQQTIARSKDPSLIKMLNLHAADVAAARNQAKKVLYAYGVRP